MINNMVRVVTLAGRALKMWRYAEFLPLPEVYAPPSADGGTPLVASRKLAEHWGVKNLYFKNDAVCFPSLSFKARVVSTALAAARPFAFETAACTSNPNPSTPTPPQPPHHPLHPCVFPPPDLD